MTEGFLLMSIRWALKNSSGFQVQVISVVSLSVFLKLIQKIELYQLLNVDKDVFFFLHGTGHCPRLEMITIIYSWALGLG